MSFSESFAVAMNRYRCETCKRFYMMEVGVPDAPPPHCPVCRGAELASLREQVDRLQVEVRLLRAPTRQKRRRSK